MRQISANFRFLAVTRPARSTTRMPLAVASSVACRRDRDRSCRSSACRRSVMSRTTAIICPFSTGTIRTS